MTQVAVSNPPSSLGLMSCVRESSPPLESAPEIVRHESKRRRFNPLLSGLRRIFGKKSRTPSASSVPDSSGSPAAAPVDQLSPPADPLRSRSTSQLSDSATPGDPAALKSRGLQSTLLSLSHDSVFTAESGGSEVDTSSCLSVQQTAQSSVRAELLDVMRRRKLQREDTSDDEDLGLPRSPLSTSPHHKTTINHSTCSEGSLLSMGSSELEEDPMALPQSRQSSKVSLYEKKVTITHDSDAELNISVTLPSVPRLSHSAAKHKMAVRPKRTHGAPRKRKHQIGAVTALPAMPEVNEDTSSARTAPSDMEDVLPEPEATKMKSTEQLNKVAPPCLKSSSLPAGALPPSSLRLARSRSNVTPPEMPSPVKSSLSDDYLSESARKDDGSFFSRLLMRRSGKKKKCGEDASAGTEPLPAVIPHKRMDEKGQYLVDMNNITSKQYPSSRQRMEPLNIPLEENAGVNRMHVSYVTSLPADDDVDSIQVVQPEPYLLRMYSGEFQPVHAFSYQDDTTSPGSADVTMPEIHSVPEVPQEDNESQDVLVDETVIENAMQRGDSSSVEEMQRGDSSSAEESKSHQIVISHKTLEKPNVPQKPVACVIPVRPHVRQTEPTSQVSKVFLSNYSENFDSSGDKPESHPRERIQHLSLNLVDTVPSPRRSVPSSPLRENSPSPLKQRSPLKEISPFRVVESPKFGSPCHDMPSPFLSKRFSHGMPSPRTPRRESGDFFSDCSPVMEEKTLDMFTPQRVMEIPSPITPKDLVLPVQTSPTKLKENAFTKEIPSPIMPKDVFQFNTVSNNNLRVDSAGESKIGKSASFTELKKEVPIPAPRISLRKDNSLPTMPEYMKVHVTTQETKKSMSSSCESLDMQDQVQSSSYSDSCDSMDNIDQWRHKKKEVPWRNRYSEVSSSDSDDKQLSITPDSSDIEKKIEEEEISIVQLRRKSFTKDWSLSQESPPRPLRQKSLEPEMLKKDAANLNEVVLRRKSLSKEMIKNSKESDEPELLKVFARRSLKIPKEFDVNDNSIDYTNVKIVSKDSDKENDADVIANKCENINQQFPLDNDKLKLKKNYESIIITTNKNLDNEDSQKTHQKELIKPFSSNVKVNMNENKTVTTGNGNTVVKTLNINTEVIKKADDKVQQNDPLGTDGINVTHTPSSETVDNMKGFKKIQQRREEWEQRMQQARKTQP